MSEKDQLAPQAGPHHVMLTGGVFAAKAQSSCPSKLDVGKGVSWCQQFQDL